MGNYFSYARISTKEVDDKQSYSRQIRGFAKYAEENKIEYLREFADDISGKSFNRPEWIKLERAIHKGDTIVFKDISRFTRQAEAGFEKYMYLMEEVGVNLVFIDNPTLSTDYIKNLMNMADTMDNRIAKITLNNTIELLLMVELDRVEREREIIVKRIKDGLAASDKIAGRRKGTLDKMSTELKEDIKEYLRDRSIKAIDLIRKHGISRNTLKKYIKIIEESNLN